MHPILQLKKKTAIASAVVEGTGKYTWNQSAVVN